MMLLTVWLVPVKLTVLPVAAAVSDVMAEVPPRLRVALAAWVSPPPPASAVFTVKEPLLL